MEGQLVASHPGTQDGQWQCSYEFAAPGHDEAKHRYRWFLLGWPPATIVTSEVPVTSRGSDIATRVTGSPTPPADMTAIIPSGFNLLDPASAPGLVN
jgi:hypothetical protein